jgi:hypothetical protein
MRIALPQVEAAIRDLKEIESMSSYDRTMQLAREGNGLALALLKACYQWVLKQGRVMTLPPDGFSEGFRL